MGSTKEAAMGKVLPSYPSMFLKLDRKVHKCHLPPRQSSWAGRSVLLLQPAAHTVCTLAPGYSDWTFPVWRCSAGSSDIHSRCGKREFPAGQKQKVELGGMWDQGIDAVWPETAGSVLMWLHMIQGEKKCPWNYSLTLRCFLNTPVWDSISLSLTVSIQCACFVMLTWYLASSLLFQREWAMSWMERRRLWVLPLKCKALGSSKSCPPICCSSWRTSCSIGIKRRKWSGFIMTAHWSSKSSRVCAADTVTCVIQI